MAAPAAAAPAPISGKLSEPGHTVIALAADGKAKSARTRDGRFTLRPPGEAVTLHLRGKNGRYAGPVVVAGRGRRVVVGVRAGARLGRIDVRAGHARVARRPRARWIDARRAARARRGVPIGVGNYGRVRARERGAAGRGRDPDRDGIPDALDIDDDGDLRLDSFDRRRRARAAQAASPVFVWSQLYLLLHETVIADPSGANGTAVDEALKTRGRLQVDIVPGDSVELDCGGSVQRPPRPQGLVYCSAGGTGRDLDGLERFPECCDAEDPPDGMGTLTPYPGSGNDFNLLHGATTEQIGTGDVMVERATTNGVEREYPDTLQFVFATVPALLSYSDTAGHTATFTYPVAGSAPDCGAGGAPGTCGNGLPVGPGPDGRIKLTVTLARPRRKSIGTEPPGWVDIGGATYLTGVDWHYTSDKPGGYCRRDAFSSVGSMTPTTLDDGQGGLIDPAPDRPAGAGSAVTFTIDLTECLDNPGGFDAPPKLSWTKDEERALFFEATNRRDIAQQFVFFRRQ